MSTLRSPLAAVAWMLAAVVSFSGMDAAMKLLSSQYPVLQVTFCAAPPRCRSYCYGCSPLPGRAR